MMTQDFPGAMIHSLNHAFSANILDAIKDMLADEGLKADLVNRRMLWTASSSLSATDYDGWRNLLRDPLSLLPSGIDTVLGS